MAHGCGCSITPGSGWDEHLPWAFNARWVREVTVTRFSWGNYLLRLLGAVMLVFLTYNPEQMSFYHWVRPVIADFARFEVLMAFAGVVLLIGWAIYLRATMRSLGAFGTLLAVAFFATLIWVLVTYTPIPWDNLKVVTYLALAAAAAVLSVGISWSHVRRRLTGQLDVDETDE